MWQWHSMDNAWWKLPTVMDNNTVKPWDDPNASPFWKDLTQIAPIFDCSIAYKIGNGNNVRFWHDNWHSSTLKYVFPNLYQATNDKHCSVQYFIMNATWQLLNSSSQPVAYVERESLLIALQTLQLTQGNDIIEWLRDSIGFSCNSAYRFLTLTHAPFSIVANLWQIKAPLQVLVFAWLLLKNRLTTIDNLMRRGWHLPSICVMCTMDEETTQHLFQTCQLARQIRSHVYSTFQPHYFVPVGSAVINSTHLLMDSDTPMTVRQIESTTCFILW